MSLFNTARWAAGVTSRLVTDFAIWTLDRATKRFADIHDVATVGRIFDDMDLTENKDHIHHDNNTV
ncbi:MAG: hypothetical protein JSV97_03000 [candidate division WOR-3 bacterium]|jgi:hypothetical protein|nr:MAG: hypothetical protein JSV97_03000 [candidate division WOR-3 bacterium]